MAHELRTCTRTGCRWPAAASLSYRYATRQVWLLDLSAQPDPSLYDLCPHHADALVVPRGWARVEQRTHREAVREPSGADLVERAVALRARTHVQTSYAPAEPRARVGAGAVTSRYAALRADLPRIAAEAGAMPERDHHMPPRPASDQAAPARYAVPSRDLAPLPPAAAPAIAPREIGVTPPMPVPEIDGQLAIPVDDADDLSGHADAVVVSIERAGARRRPGPPDVPA